MKKYIKILGKVRPTVDGDWSKDKSYDILTIVYDKDSKKSYISRKKVPVGINILNKDYWMNISTTRVDNDSIVLLSNPNDIGQINSFTLQEAVDSFDNEDKRIGLFISFYEKPIHELDTYKWNLYQFIGSDINQFNDITKWISIYNRSNKFLGLYLTEGKLNEVKRSPEVGDYAFVGNTLKEAIVYRCNVNGKWTKTKESAVDYIELKLSGNVTVGENGNWFNDGVDTGFKAKGEDGKTPQIVVSKDNKLQVSYDGVNFTNITENIVYTQYRVSGNKLQYSIDLGKTWNDASGFISANFRWKPTNIAAGKIQISRENEVWEDLSPEFVSNSADEEDLESVIIGDNNRVIREKSIKEYNPAEFSGLGRVILRKNIVQGKNVLTQEMINKPNTIYEIRYDFDLNDATINIPENCTLDFQGGSIKNGTLNFNYTLINAPLYHIFYNIITKGYSPSDCQVEWFGAKSYSRIDTNFTYSSDAIQDAFNSCFGNIYFNVGIYYIDKTLEMSHYKTLNFKGSYNWSVKTTYDYSINNINASTLCVLTDIDILHIKCECKEVPNDINSTIKILGYGVIDITKVDNYSKTAVKIIIRDVNVTGSIIHLHIINNTTRITTLEQVEEASKNDYGTSIGIELVNNSTQDGLSIYSTEIDGIIEGFRYGIKNNIPNRCFPTAFIFKCTISQCITAIDFGESGIMGSYVVCNHIQSKRAFSINNNINYPLFIGWLRDIYIDTYVWDLDLSSNDVYFHKYILNATARDEFKCSPLMYSHFNKAIVGDLPVNVPYSNLKLISKLNTFEKNSPYYIDFLTNDYLDTDNYTISTDIPIDTNPFSIDGLLIKNNSNLNGKNLQVTLTCNENIGINKIIIETTNSLSQHFESIVIEHKNKKNVIFKTDNIKNIGTYNNFLCISEQLIHGEYYKEAIITFNNYITDNVKSPLNYSRIIIKVSGFKHTYKHINTQSSTIIKPGGIFSLHGHKFRSVSNESITFLENQFNGSRFYSTAGQPRYFKDEEIINAVKASPNAYGNGAQFYKYKFNEGSLVIYDKANNKYFALKGAILGKATSGTFNEKPDIVPEGYFYLVKDVKPDGKIEFKPIYAKENGDYIDALGNPANALHIGTTVQRPTGVQIGFTYKDTDLNKWIIWNGEAWENIDGASLI